MRFIEVTLQDNSRAYVNVDKVCVITKYDGNTVKSHISLDNGEKLNVRDTCSDIILKMYRNEE